MQYIIETFDLCKYYTNVKAVDRLNLKIKKGEIFGLLGPNGAGKTTAISMLCTILPPTSGTATVNGFDIIEEPGEVRKSIGIVFQQPSVDDLLTGRENLMMHTLLFKMPKEIRKKRIDEVLMLVDLEKRADDLVKTYSGGMRRRLELARGMMHYPTVLFLDEPTLGLDPQTREHIWRYISTLARKEKMTILLTTHYMEEAELLCDRVGIIDAGKIIALDEPEKLKSRLGGDKIIIRTKNPKLAVLRKLDCVKAIHRQGDMLQIVLNNRECDLKKILLNAGDVKSVELKPTTLNDVFLHYTGKQIRENEAEGGFWQRIMSERRT
ncbi:MAG: ATP-binding cassette domain-containing protein [Candidatus Hadarchaeum sp.]|uniref:ATP-binding cassette domain-containing protein n=1 Tax=Candidatus Hadarchaeum sp. TaxID=2883567 RepID=UPI0031808406